ncbi:MAG: S-layer protein, partial [Microcystaceae cyanobacterium]
MAPLTTKLRSACLLGTLFGCSLLGHPVSAQSAPPPQDYANYTALTNQLNQITNVNQLQDVSPQDWSYEALKNLVENYGCIVGYPDRTYRG